MVTLANTTPTIMTAFSYILAVALCAACIAYTISMTSIFKWLRDFVEKHLPEKIDELIHCPYCLSHYIVLAIMFTTKNLNENLIHINDFVVYNFLFTWFVIVCIIALIHFVMVRAYAPVAELETFRKLKKFRQNDEE